MNRLSEKIKNILKEYTYFPDPVMNTQIKKVGKTLEDLNVQDLPKLAPEIGKAISLFSNPAKGEEVKNKILALQ